MRIVIALLVGLVTCLFPHPALGASDLPIVQTRELPLTIRTTNAPIYASEFIQRAPAFSAALLKAKSKKPLHYDAKLAALLEQVNTEGNTKITWTREYNTFGQREYWDFPCESAGKLYDDCDGFAIWKMRRLMELGVPSTPLLFTLTYDETKNFHAVLVVATDAGDFVLDNRQSTVKPVHELIALGYNFASRVASGDRFDGMWVEFKPTYPVPPLAPDDYPIATSTPNPPRPINPLCPRP